MSKIFLIFGLFVTFVFPAHAQERRMFRRFAAPKPLVSEKSVRSEAATTADRETVKNVAALLDPAFLYKPENGDKVTVSAHGAVLINGVEVISPENVVTFQEWALIRSLDINYFINEEIKARTDEKEKNSSSNS